MPSERFPFTIHAVLDGVSVTMNCGKGVYRARPMPAELLSDLIDACGTIRRDIIDDFRREHPDDAPPFPRCVEIGGGTVGTCDVLVTACRCDTHVECSIAFYDEGDRTAPALLLTDEQIDQFIRRGNDVLKELAELHPSTTEATDVPKPKTA